MIIPTPTHILYNHPPPVVTAKVLACYASDTDYPHHSILITDQTPFHPLSAQWPDQPGDQGILTDLDQQHHTITDTIVVAIDPHAKTFYYGSTIREHRDKALIWCVGHVITTDITQSQTFINQAVELCVDRSLRQTYSLNHSICHIAALALNQTLAPYWRKTVRKDTLEHPDFDQLAIQQSCITPTGSLDRYRLGKSLRKKGLNTDTLFNELTTITQAVNKTTQHWLNSEPTIELTPETGLLMDRRLWQCQLPVGLASIPCGGTHIRKIPPQCTATICLEKTDDQPELVMTTRVTQE